MSTDHHICPGGMDRRGTEVTDCSLDGGTGGTKLAAAQRELTEQAVARGREWERGRLK